MDKKRTNNGDSSSGTTSPRPSPPPIAPQDVKKSYRYAKAKRAEERKKEAANRAANLDNYDHLPQFIKDY